jgi:H+/gluconate symporter-like permease
MSDPMGLIGIVLALGLLIWLAYKGWSVLLLAPAAALIAGTAMPRRQSFQRFCRSSWW